MVRIWLTGLIRRVLIGILLVGLTLGVGMIWRCYALEGSPLTQSGETEIANVGGDYGLTVKQKSNTIIFLMDHLLPAPNLSVSTGSSIYEQIENRNINCQIYNTDNGHEEATGTWVNEKQETETIGTIPGEPWETEEYTTINLKEVFPNGIERTLFYHADTQTLSPVRSGQTYQMKIECHYELHTLMQHRPNPIEQPNFWIFERRTSTHAFGANHFNITTTAPPSEDPPFRTTMASHTMQMPGRDVRYAIPNYDETEYYDEYAVIANPSAISAIHVNSTKGIFGLNESNSSEEPPQCWFPGNPRYAGQNALDDNDLNKQLIIGNKPNKFFRLKTCNLTPTIRAAADLSNGIIYTANVYLINRGHNRIAGTLSIPIHVNDLRLPTSWTVIKPNVADHGYGTDGLGTNTDPFIKFIDGEPTIIKGQFRNLYWKINEGDSDGHASFTADGCSNDPAYQYPEENNITQQFDYYPTVWFCSPGKTTIGAYISDLPNRNHLIRRWTINISLTPETNTQEDGVNVGETDVKDWPGAPVPPTPTPEPVLSRSIIVNATPTPAPTKGPFLYIPALTPTPVPPPDVLPGHEDYTRQQEFTNETPIIESVGAVERNDNNTYKVNVRFSTVTGADRYEIRITQPVENGETNIIQHLPVNNPDGNQFTFDTLHHKGRLKIEVRGVAECPDDNVGACVVQTLNDPEYRINPGVSEYTPWSLPYGTAMEFLLTPPLINPDSVNTIGDDTGRYVNTAGNSLNKEIGGLAVRLLGLNTDATRNMGITIWAMICLGLATGVYIAAWKGSGTKSALSPVGGFLAVLTLIITWSVLGYIFWELKAGTAALPLAGLLFIGIFKVWNTIKA